MQANQKYGLGQLPDSPRRSMLLVGSWNMLRNVWMRLVTIASILPVTGAV